MKRRKFIFLFLFSLSKNIFYTKNIYANNFDLVFKTITNIPSNLPEDFYSGELIEDTLYIPIKSKGYILTFNLNTRKTSKIDLPIGAYPDIVFHSKNYGLFIGSYDQYPPLIIKDISSKKVSYIDEEYNEKNFFQKTTLKRLSITSIKESPSGEKVFIGNSRGHPIIYTKSLIIPISNSNFNDIRSYDAVWLSENEILISSHSKGKALFFRLRNNKTELVNEFNIKGAYRFSPIVNNKIILSTRDNGKVYIFQIFKKNNINQDHNIKSLKSIRVPFKYHFFQRIIPAKILESYKWGKYVAYFNDVHWVTENTFALTTRTGNSVILMNLNGEILSLKRNMDLVPTRFIGSRLPNSKCFFISKSNSSQVNLLDINNTYSTS